MQVKGNAVHRPWMKKAEASERKLSMLTIKPQIIL